MALDWAESSSTIHIALPARILQNPSGCDCSQIRINDGRAISGHDWALAGCCSPVFGRNPRQESGGASDRTR